MELTWIFFFHDDGLIGASIVVTVNAARRIFEGTKNKRRGAGERKFSTSSPDKEMLHFLTLIGGSTWFDSWLVMEGTRINFTALSQLCKQLLHFRILYAYIVGGIQIFSRTILSLY